MNEEVNKKDSIKKTILGVMLFLAMAFSSIGATEKMYNLLPFYSVDGLDFSTVSFVAIRYIMPFLMAAIYYFIYRIYISIICNSLNVRMRLFGQETTRTMLREQLDPCFIICCVLIGVVEIIFYVFPLYAQLLKTLFKEMAVALTIWLMYYRLTKNLDKIFRPVIFSALLWPGILLVVFA